MLVPLPSDYAVPETESPPRCELLDDGRNAVDDEGNVRTPDREADTCSDDIECSPHVVQRESGKHGQGYLDHDAWCNEMPYYLEAMWPEATARMGSRNYDTDWIYLQVWMGHWYSSAYRDDVLAPDEPQLCAYGAFDWTIYVAETTATPERLVFVAAGVQHFAVYEHVLVDAATGDDHFLVRFWVGVMLHPSVWWQPSGQDHQDPYGFDDLPPEVTNADDLGLFRLQLFMSAVVGVRAKVAWTPLRQGSGACRGDNVTNVRYFPCGGEDREVYSSTDWIPGAGWTTVTEGEPYYSGSRAVVGDVGPVALQPTAGRATSIVGNMVRCDVRINDVGHDGKTIAERVGEAYRCAFGARNKVLTKLSIDYTPAEDPTGQYRVSSRRCLSSHDLLHVDEFVAHMRNRCQGDAWRELIFNRLDYLTIDEDRL